MASLYDYLREDGEWVSLPFPFGKAPAETVCDDGVKAKKGFKPGRNVNIGWKPGSEPSSVLKTQSEKRRRDNINAGKKGEKDWRQRMPKLVKQ